MLEMSVADGDGEHLGGDGDCDVRHEEKRVGTAVLAALMMIDFEVVNSTGTFFSSRELRAVERVSVDVASPVTKITVVT